MSGCAVIGLPEKFPAPSHGVKWVRIDLYLNCLSTYGSFFFIWTLKLYLISLYAYIYIYIFFFLADGKVFVPDIRIVHVKDLNFVLRSKIYVHWDGSSEHPI